MSQKPHLTTYKFRVFGGDADAEPTDIVVHGVGRDVQRAEQLFADRGWGSTQSRPMTSAAVVCYYAMLRTGYFSGTWAEFEEWYLAIEPVESDTAVPTEPGREPG
jgi:hypothetical protein